MLRLTEADVQTVDAFQGRHAEAKKDGFGHLLRSPTLWEDLVKSITLCNCGCDCSDVLQCTQRHSLLPAMCTVTRGGTQSVMGVLHALNMSYRAHGSKDFVINAGGAGR